MMNSLSLLKWRRLMGKRVMVMLGFLAFLLPGIVFSYELSPYNLNAPSRLGSSDLELAVRHRFYGIVTDDPVGDFLGIDQGANVSLGLKYMIRDDLEVNAAYTRDHGEYSLGIAYSQSVEELFLSGRFDVEFFSFERLGINETRENFFYQLTLQGDLLENRIKPLAGVGYDGYNERVGFGLGFAIMPFEEVPWFKEMALLGEYYPVNRGGDDDLFLGKKDCFAFGVGLRTWGHQFLFMLGNSTEIGSRRLMLGSDSDDLMFGFTIRRLLRSE
jgi:hypothetical protein